MRGTPTPQQTPPAESLFSFLGEEALWRATAETIRPKDRVDPLTFGTIHRVYSKEGKSSRWRPDETPWAAAILHACSEDSPYRRIPCPKGTQLGFTELGLILCGQGVASNQSMLIIEPTEAVAKRVVKTKFRPMLKSTTILADAFPGRALDTTLHFSNDQVDVMFAGSNSPTNFATITVPRVMGDEVDRWSPELLNEGDPVDLLENRIAEYGFLGKLFLPSSPTVEGVSIVWREWLQSDQRQFTCPCPNCGEKHAWTWDMIKTVQPDGALGAPSVGDPGSVVMECPDCGIASSEREWKAIWGQGEWVATNPTPIRLDSAGFHLSTLYARYGQRTWAQLVQQYQAVVKSGLPARMQTFWNTILGLPWKVTEDAIPVDELRGRLEPLERSVVPVGGLCLVAGVDYQANRAEIFVWAIGRMRERWLVDKVVVERLKPDGSKRPSADVAREMKAEALEKAWPHDSGGALTVEYSCHDTGNLPADVFDILDHLAGSKSCGTKGREGWGEKLAFLPPKVIDVKRDGKVVAYGRRLAGINTAVAKTEWYADLRRTPAEAGPSERYVHLPEWIDEEQGLLEQFVSEEVRKTTRGKLGWVKVFDRNEGLDCAILGAAAAWQLKTHRWSEAEWAKREKRVGVKVDDSSPPAAPASSPGRSRVRGRMT